MSNIDIFRNKNHYNKYKLYYKIGTKYPIIPEIFQILHGIYNDIIQKNNIKRFIYKRYDYQENILPFREVFIETINRCNGKCSFCNVNRASDNRAFHLMDENVFRSICEQLGDMNYSGVLALYLSNEPLMDKRIAELCRIARKEVPLSPLYLCSNGSLLTIDKFVELMKYLNFLNIDNYDDKLKLNPHIKEIYDYITLNSEYQNRVVIQLRRENEVLRNLCGKSPNRKRFNFYKLSSSCILPFKQLNIHANGDVGICCSDTLCDVSIGNVSNNMLMDIWNGEKANSARTLIIKGRKYFSLCKYCDAFDHKE